MSIKPLTCPQCGGTINRERMICEYCGTKFQIEDNGFSSVLRVETYSSPTTTLQVRTEIPNELVMRAGEEVVDMAKNEIANRLAEKLLAGELIEFRSKQDWRRCQQIISARLRVLHPTYRF